MSSLVSPDAPAPAPRPNPFAKATSQTSFSRSGSLLPLRSPSATPNAASTPQARRPWRLLWRGGLEVGPDGWRLDGITFFAMLDLGASPAAAPDADLCLSLESLRGRKHLPVRGLVPLSDAELDADDSVQLSVESPLLASFLSASLCAAAKLTPAGRTAVAVEVGLGDAGVGEQASTIVIYGQQRTDGGALRLCVGRRAAPPSPRKVRPGEPLPRAPLLFPTKAARRPRPPLARSASAAVYAPPPGLAASSLSSASAATAVPDGRTPGRRGEKRPRKDDGGADDKRRRAGRIVRPERAGAEADEDIFGRRSASLAPAPAPAPAPPESEADPPPPPRRHVSAQAADNRAMVRKQALVALGARGVGRDDAGFKDVFALVTKGTYFAVRRTIDSAALDKAHVQDIIGRHLDMYLDDAGAGAGAGADDGEATDKD